MCVPVTCRVLAICLAAVTSACASGGSEREAASGAPTQASSASGCETVARFSRISFVAADRNNDGVINEAEFAADAAAAFAGEDKDHDGRLTRAELPGAPSGAVERVSATNSDVITFKDLMAAKMAQFDRADTNKDGVLSIVEVTQFNERQGVC
jgi:hypothetical protein